MALMFGSLYAALIEGGTSEEKATRAAEELATYADRFQKVETDIALIKFQSQLILGGIMTVLLGVAVLIMRSFLHVGG